MPHVVLTGSIALKAVFETLVPFTTKNEKQILRAQKRYIDHEETSILVESLAIEGGKNTNFFVLVGLREDGLVIRIHPNSDVEKTDGVKMVLAEIANQLLQKFPELKIGKTNLQDFL